MIEVYTFRHGETDWNRKRIFQGQRDIPLNATGAQQATALRDTLYATGIRFTYILSSDLQRAYRTAEIVCDPACDPWYRTHSIVPDTDLRERMMGILEGTHYAPDTDPFTLTLQCDDIRGAEPLEEVLARANRIPGKVRQYGDAAVVGVFSHGSFIATLPHAFAKQPFAPQQCKLLQNGTYHHFTLSPNGDLLEARLHCTGRDGDALF